MLKNIAPKGSARTIGNARRLRGEMSLPEAMLWRVLRTRPNGLKFRRQHPTGGYVLDFFCADARLAIELDGEAHSRGRRPARDAARDEWLTRWGIATLRIPAAEVLGDLDAAVRLVLAKALERLPLHHPAAPGGPPPRGKLGED